MVKKNSNKMCYDLYLFSCLLKEFNKEFAEQPYDMQYDILPSLFETFEKSGFDDKEKGLYECIVKYLENNPSLELEPKYLPMLK